MRTPLLVPHVFFVCVIILFNAATAPAQWERTKGPFGGVVRDLASNAAGDLFAATDGGLFRSTNGGATWEGLTFGMTAKMVFAVAVNADGHVFAAGDTGLFRTTDNGETWEQIQEAFGGGIVRSLQIATRYMLAGTGGGLYRSSDSGNTWVRVLFAGAQINDFLLHANGSVFAATGGGVYRSTNNGESWEQVNVGIGLGFRTVNSLAANAAGDIFAGVNGNAVYRSTNNGASWTLNTLTTGPIQCVVVTSSGDVFAGAAKSVFRSTNSGQTWQQAGLLKHGIRSLFISSRGDLFAGTDGDGVFRSADNGTTWLQINNGLNASVLNGLAVSPNGNVFAGTLGGGVARSTDGGVNWVQVLSSPLLSGVAVNRDGIVFAGCGLDGVFRSTDNGATWEQVNVGISGKDIRALAVTSDGVLFAGAQYDGIYRSSNNGASWEQTLPHPLIVPNTIVVKEGGVVIVGTNTAFYRSTDGGATWQWVLFGGNSQIVVYSLTVAANGDLFATAGTWMLRSTNNGATWLLAGTITAPRALASSNRAVFAATNANIGVVYRSSDNGTTWARIDSSFIPKHVSVLAVTTQGDLLAGTQGSGVWRMKAPNPLGTSFSIADRGGISLTSTGSLPTTTVGFAKIEANAESTSPSGIAVFGFRQNGVLVTEAGVPASPLLRYARIYAEVGGGVDTGLAIANPNTEPASVSFFFTGPNGNFGKGATTIPANGQIAAFLSQPPFNGVPVNGSFTFNSTVPVAVVSLRGFTNERGEFLITTLPVADLSVPAPAGNLVFPHFAAGGGWSTKIVLVNPSDGTLTGTVRFLAQSGESAVILVNGESNSTVQYSIPPRTSRTLQADGAAATAVGSVRVTPAAGTTPPFGVAIFSFASGGVTVTEAGVPVSDAGTLYRLYVETAGTFGEVGSIQTGLAITNLGTSPATVTLNAHRLDGSFTGISGTLTVPANGQTALFLNQVPGFASLQSPFKGVLRLSSTAQISVVGLRGRYNERSDFLITTTLPSNEGATPSKAHFFFPHFADSGGYTTQFILFSGQLNQSPSGTMGLFSRSGQLLTLPFQ